MWWQKAVALVVMVVALVGYPLILLQESGLYIGGGVQPRYLLPMMLMFAGMSLLPRAGHRITAEPVPGRGPDGGPHRRAVDRRCT